MSAREPLVFWRRRLHLAGDTVPEVALSRLRALLAPQAGLSMNERMVGRIEGRQIRVWKKTLFGNSADVVQFVGELQPDGEGTAIVGTLEYKLATKVQFVGGGALGIAILAAGAMQHVGNTPSAAGVMAFGGVLAGTMFLWALTARHMKERQVAFLEQELKALLVR